MSRLHITFSQYLDEPLEEMAVFEAFARGEEAARNVLAEQAKSAQQTRVVGHR